MHRMLLVATALACALAVPGAAMAQRRGAPRGGGSEDNLPPSVPPAVSTLAPVRGISGPRLQPGAVLCATETALRHRADVTRRQSEGQSDTGNPMESCHLVREERGVEIVDRRGLGMTQVKVKPTGETGWTDSYMR